MEIRKISGILCAGNISWDILVRPVDEFRWGSNTWVEDYLEDMGGNGSNTSYCLGRFGVPVRLLGMVGRDERGDALLAKLRLAGADVTLVSRSGEPTTTTICVTNSQGERLFFQRLGSSKEAFAEPSDFRPRIVGQANHYHQANLYSLPNLRRNSVEQMRRARQAGLTVSVDTGWSADGKWMETLGPVLPYTDLLFVNQQEAEMLTGEQEPEAMAARLREQGARSIVLKLGAEGCGVFSGNESRMVPGFPVAVVDTTGAGDCFAAGFLGALYRGVDYFEAARFANAAGALAVTALGAVRGMDGISEWRLLEEWMEGARRESRAL
ncbi:MAG: carbohydrate kinase family protein [Acidobacteriia bacterium]|nr:carbohydrate kinase family protein [Terriglobia bacterium]